MPYTKRRYKRSKRTRRGNRRRRRKASPIVPDSKMVKLRYVERFTLNPGVAGTLSAASYLANGLYDPTVAVGGHQPLGFDQWMTFYNHFTVVGSKCQMIASSTDTGLQAGNMAFGIYLDDDISTSTIGSNLETMMEQPKVNWNLLDPHNSNKATVSHTFSLKKQLRKSVGDDDVQGNLLADPTETSVYHLWAAPVSVVEDSSQLNCIAIIDYTVVFTERKELASS